MVLSTLPMACVDGVDELARRRACLAMKKSIKIEACGEQTAFHIDLHISASPISSLALFVHTKGYFYSCCFLPNLIAGSPVSLLWLIRNLICLFWGQGLGESSRPTALILLLLNLLVQTSTPPPIVTKNLRNQPDGLRIVTGLVIDARFLECIFESTRL